jgi:hypothetical protein
MTPETIHDWCKYSLTRLSRKLPIILIIPSLAFFEVRLFGGSGTGSI